jgi:hypothetical protein
MRDALAVAGFLLAPAELRTDVKGMDDVIQHFAGPRVRDSYYEERQRGLGLDLALEVQAAIQNIVAFPRAWPVVEGEIRDLKV